MGIKKSGLLRKCGVGALLSVFWLSSYAQSGMIRRGRIENVTDYSSMSLGVQDGKKKVGKRSDAPLTSEGTPKVPVVLVQFSDMSFSVGDMEEDIVDYYNSFLNDEANSVSAYFNEQSYGQFKPEFVVIGPITLSKAYSYYGADQGTTKDVNIKQFYSESCSAAVKMGVDWSDFDNNSDGKVDFIFFIYAGQGQNDTSVDDSNLIWPKENASSVSVTVDESSVSFGGFGCTCELIGQVGDGIGTMCHKLSHALGLPDFYDYSYTNAGLGYWDVMDSGCYQYDANNPIGYSAYERDFMGWRSLVTLDPAKKYSLVINPLETDGVGYKIVNESNANEYFVIENRQNINADKYLGWPSKTFYNKFGENHGLLISHIVYNAYAWTNNRVNTTPNYYYKIVSADGTFADYSNNTTAEKWYSWAEDMLGDLYPGSKNVTEMSDYSTTYGSSLNQTIANIREVDGLIYVDINGGEEVQEETSFEFTDGEKYELTESKTGVDVSYTRTFNHTKWTSLYIPFSLSYEDFKDDFEIAQLTGVSGDGDDAILEIEKITEGSTEANKPYFIRPKSTGTYTIELEDVTLSKAESNSFSVSDGNYSFVLTGTYDGVSGDVMFGNGYYACSGGLLCKVPDADTGLGTYRWYLDIQPVSSAREFTPANVRVRLVSTEANAITDVEVAGESGQTYTLDGRVVNGEPMKSTIYIKDGKKTLVR